MKVKSLIYAPDITRGRVYEITRRLDYGFVVRDDIGEETLLDFEDCVAVLEDGRCIQVKLREPEMRFYNRIIFTVLEIHEGFYTIISRDGEIMVMRRNQIEILEEI